MLKFDRRLWAWGIIFIYRCIFSTMVHSENLLDIIVCGKCIVPPTNRNNVAFALL